jgi:UDP-glucose 4-epimerase
MKNVLVTGAAGFMGAHLVRELQKKNFNVVALDDLSGGFKDNLPTGIDFIKGSINDIELMQSLFKKYKFEYVYHLAAYAAEGLSHFIRRFNYENNLIGSVNLINESIKHNVKCFVFTSSIAVYGAGQVPMIEEMTPMPEDPYGIAKYAIELDLKNAHDMFGLNYVIFRPHNVYGEYQNIGDKYRNVVGIFMNQILKDKPFTIFGDGEQQRAFSYVGDITDIIAESAWTQEAYNNVFNIGADTPYTVNQLAKEICVALNKPNYPIRHLDARNEVKIAYSDHSKAKKIFGQRKTTSLNEGLQKMANWVDLVGARESTKFKNIEITRNLPPLWLE